MTSGTGTVDQEQGVRAQAWAHGVGEGGDVDAQGKSPSRSFVHGAADDHDVACAGEGKACVGVGACGACVWCG